MSNGSGGGGNILKRPPPRKPEDQDATISHRSTRGTGLPPPILSSGRGRGRLGIGRGGTRECPVVRSQSGSVPPWAMRGRQVDTYIPLASGRGDGIPGRPRFDREPPTQPKWDREKSRTPLPSSRIMPRSPPPTLSNGTGGSLGYSAGPSHQRWMSPQDQAGPSKYTVNESSEGLVSTLPSPSITQNPSQTELTQPLDDAMQKNTQMDVKPTTSEPLRQSSASQPPNHEESTNMTPDEKEDVYADSPGAGPSKAAGSSRKAEVKEEMDVKPNLAALMEEEIPTILDEDREDGVLAVKRELVLQCYEKNPTVRSTARKAFRAQKTAELSAVGRIVQHVLWRDDGVGVQWKKAPKSRSPTKAATATNTVSTAINVDPSPPRRTAVLPPPSLHTPAERRKTPPPSAKPQPASSAPTPVLAQTCHDAVLPNHTTNPPALAVQPEAGPSRLSPNKSAPNPTPQDTPTLTLKEQKIQQRTEAKAEANKRKAESGDPALSTDKAAKQPKTSQTVASEAAQEPVLTKKQRKELNRERQEELALNASVPRTPSQKKSDRKKAVKARDAARLAKAQRKENDRLNRLAKSAAQERVLTSTNALPLRHGPTPGSMPDRAIEIEGNSEAAGPTIKDKGKGKAREIVDLSETKAAEGEERRGPGNSNVRTIVDLTRESGDVDGKAGSSSTPKSSNSSVKKSVNLPLEADGPTSSGPSNSRVAVKPPANPISSASLVRPARPPSISSTPSAHPSRPPVPTGPPARPRPPPSHALGLSTLPSRPPNPIALTTRPKTAPGYTARPSPPSSTVPRPPPSSNTIHRPPPSANNRPPHSASMGRPPPPGTTMPRPAPPSINGAGVGTGRPPPQPQYQNQAGQSSYSERQALAALARPPLSGQSARPPPSKFTARPPTAPPAPGRPAASVRPSAARPLPAPGRPNPSGTNQTKPMQRNQTLPSSSPMSSGTDLFPSRSMTPAVVTPRYTELRQALSEKMEEMDNWTSMLVDLPDRAEMTRRQIDRTRQECFDLQKQMREEKEKTR